MQQHSVIIMPSPHIASGQFSGDFSQQNCQPLIHPSAIGTVQHHLVVPHLIRKIFQHKRSVRRKTSVRVQLFMHIFGDVHRRRLTARPRGQKAHHRARLTGFFNLPEHSAEHFARGVASAHAIASPEGRLGSLGRRLPDNHTVAFDPDDGPRKGAQQEFIAKTRFKDEFFIQFAQLRDAVFQHHHKQTPVWYCPSGGKRQHF